MRHDLRTDITSALAYIDGLTSSAAHAHEQSDVIRALRRLQSELNACPERWSWSDFSKLALYAQHACTKETEPFLESLKPDPADPEERQNEEVRHDAAYFVFALPLEQMAYYVNRSPSLRRLAPELGALPRLAYFLDWMSGIQFYLGEPFEVTDGHIVCLDSEWSLTAIEQTKHWHDVKLPKQVKAILSVDIARWDRRGRLIQKEPYNCTEEEIAQEVWAQLKVQLNRRTAVLRDDMLRDAKPGATSPDLRKGFNFHIDEALVDKRDRKKQALYEKARGVRFSAAELQESALAEPDPPGESYMYGPNALYNVEPLLVNRVGSRQFRPASQTGVRNMFLAGDYVLTTTDLACMEGANEAARLAVNAILDATGSRAERCRLWSFFRLGDLGNFASALLPSAAAQVASRGVSSALQTAKDRLLETFGQQLKTYRRDRDKQD